MNLADLLEKSGTHTLASHCTLFSMITLSAPLPTHPIVPISSPQAAWKRSSAYSMSLSLVPVIRQTLRPCPLRRDSRLLKVYTLVPSNSSAGQVIPTSSSQRPRRPSDGWIYRHDPASGKKFSTERSNRARWYLFRRKSPRRPTLAEGSPYWQWLRVRPSISGEGIGRGTS